MVENRSAMSSPPLRFPRPDDVFHLRISLLEVEPQIWRRLLVPQAVTLPLLHSIIQVTMGWEDSHLYDFRVGQVVFGEPTLEYEPGPIDHRRVTLNQILPNAGASCVYEYDLGDGWEHELHLEEALPIQTVSGSIPRCVAGERACPPEDCGGPHGYSLLVEALRDPDHEEHEHYVTWTGGGFAPDHFDLEAVNRRLARTGARHRRR
jgi:hypothetical protein